MSDFLDGVAEDCKEAERDLGTALGPRTVTWDGADYDCAPSLIRRGTFVVIGGREEEIKLTLRVRNKGVDWDFRDAIPKSGQRVVYGLVPYRILQVNQAHGAFMEWDLGSINR